MQRGTATGLPWGHSDTSFGYGGSRAENEEQAAGRCCYLGARGQQGRVGAVGSATRCVLWDSRLGQTSTPTRRREQQPQLPAVRATTA